MTDLSSLIARLEKAKGPSRELDAHIRLALLVKDDAAYAAKSPFNGEWVIYAGEYNGRPSLYENRNRSIPTDLWRGAYTSSIDAAVSLAERVLPGWRWEVTTTGYKPGASIVGDVPMSREGAYAVNPAIALCIATLRALNQKGSSNG